MPAPCAGMSPPVCQVRGSLRAPKRRVPSRPNTPKSTTTKFKKKNGERAREKVSPRRAAPVAHFHFYVTRPPFPHLRAAERPPQPSPAAARSRGLPRGSPRPTHLIPPAAAAPHRRRSGLSGRRGSAGRRDAAPPSAPCL